MELKKMENQVIRGLLTPLKLSRIDAVAFHHIAHPTWTAYDVERYHIITNGWMAIGYNYFINFDGTILEGRGLNVPAGISGHNSHVISVALQGDFMESSPTDAQYKACAELYKYLKEKIPSIKKYARHSDYNATACPGKYFDIEKITELLNKKEEKKVEEKIYNNLEACPSWTKEAVNKAINWGLIEGEPGGNLNLNDLKVWAIVVIVRAISLMKNEER